MLSCAGSPRRSRAKAGRDHSPSGQLADGSEIRPYHYHAIRHRVFAGACWLAGDLSPGSADALVRNTVRASASNAPTTDHRVQARSALNRLSSAQLPGALPPCGSSNRPAALDAISMITAAVAIRPACISQKFTPLIVST